MYINDGTLLTEQMAMNVSYHYPESAEIPIGQKDMKMTMVYKEFNAVKSITLPDEAKQAQELPIPSAPSQVETKPERAVPVPPSK